MRMVWGIIPSATGMGWSTIFHGKIHYFDWAMFNCYVSLPEGKYYIHKLHNFIYLMYVYIHIYIYIRYVFMIVFCTTIRLTILQIIYTVIFWEQTALSHIPPKPDLPWGQCFCWFGWHTGRAAELAVAATGRGKPNHVSPLWTIWVWPIKISDLDLQPICAVPLWIGNTYE